MNVNERYDLVFNETQDHQTAMWRALWYGVATGACRHIVEPNGDGVIHHFHSFTKDNRPIFSCLSGDVFNLIETTYWDDHNDDDFDDDSFYWGLPGDLD